MAKRVSANDLEATTCVCGALLIRHRGGSSWWHAAGWKAVTHEARPDESHRE